MSLYRSCLLCVALNRKFSFVLFVAVENRSKSHLTLTTSWWCMIVRQLDLKLLTRMHHSTILLTAKMFLLELDLWEGEQMNTRKDFPAFALPLISESLICYSWWLPLAKCTYDTAHFTSFTLEHSHKLTAHRPEDLHQGILCKKCQRVCAFHRAPFLWRKLRCHSGFWREQILFAKNNCQHQSAVENDGDCPGQQTLVACQGKSVTIANDWEVRLTPRLLATSIVWTPNWKVHLLWKCHHITEEKGIFVWFLQQFAKKKKKSGRRASIFFPGQAYLCPIIHRYLVFVQNHVFDTQWFDQICFRNSPSIGSWGQIEEHHGGQFSDELSKVWFCSHTVVFLLLSSDKAQGWCIWGSQLFICISNNNSFLFLRWFVWSNDIFDVKYLLQPGSTETKPCY